MIATVPTTSDGIQLTNAGIAGIATFAALLNLRLTQANERRRNQPIVIAHESGGRRFAHNSDAA